MTIAARSLETLWRDRGRGIHAPTGKMWCWLDDVVLIGLFGQLAHG